MENQIILINLVPNMSTPAVVRVSQYDVGRPLVFKVYDGTSPADLTGVTAVIEGTKKSGLGFSESGTVSDNTVTLDTTLAMTQEYGSIPAEIRFTKTGEDVGTANFILAVEKTPHAEGTTDGTTETMADLQSQLDALDTRVEALEAGGGGGGLTEAVKSAMLQIVQKVAYIDENGQTYYDTLYDALYPPAELVSISAVYTQSGTVYDTDSLDSLKSDLVVTANYSGGTSETVPSTDYTLSGTLTEGTSTITVSYGGKTTTFNVTVTENTMPYVRNGLIHMWDGIENTLSGHDSSASTWSDLVGSLNLTRNSTDTTWDSDSAVIRNNKMNQYFSNAGGAMTCAGKSFEIVFVPSASQTSSICKLFSDSSGQGKACIYTDNTFTVRGASGKTYPTGESALTDLHYICGTFDSSGNINSVYGNGQAVTEGSTTHSLSGTTSDLVVGQADSGYRFGGKIHAVRIYDRILSASEVASNYAADVNRFGI